MQGNTTEIDERNLLRLDALLSHGYGLSPQLVMRSKGLSIEAKALYSYLSSFAGAGDTAFPSTSRILEELDISKNRFYKIRKELISWGFISIETTATSLRNGWLFCVSAHPQKPMKPSALKLIASRPFHWSRQSILIYAFSRPPSGFILQHRLSDFRRGVMKCGVIPAR